MFVCKVNRRALKAAGGWKAEKVQKQRDQQRKWNATLCTGWGNKSASSFSFPDGSQIYKQTTEESYREGWPKYIFHIIIDIFSNGLCWEFTWNTNTKYFFLLDMKRIIHCFQCLKNRVCMFVHKQLCVQSRKCLSVSKAVYKPVTPVQPGDLGQNSCNLWGVCGRKSQIFGPNHILICESGKKKKKW